MQISLKVVKMLCWELSTVIEGITVFKEQIMPKLCACALYSQMYIDTVESLAICFSHIQCLNCNNKYVDLNGRLTIRIGGCAGGSFLLVLHPNQV